MKKLLVFLLCTCIIATMFTVSVFADDSSEGATDGIDTIAPTDTVTEPPTIDGIEENTVIISDITDTETTPDTEAISEESTAEAIPLTSDSADTVAALPTVKHTLETRLVEYWATYRAEIVSAMGTVILFVISLLVKTMNDKKTRQIASNVLTIKKGTETNVSAQADVVDRMNALIDEFNKLSDEYKALKASYDAYGATEDDRNRVVGALVAQTTAVLEILTTVYVNSKNLPQGVKDIVSLKYANCLKSLDDDTQLKAIVEAVRENIGGGHNTPTEEVVKDEEQHEG